MRKKNLFRWTLGGMPYLLLILVSAALFAIALEVAI